MATPTGTVQATAMSREMVTRSKVAAAERRVSVVQRGETVESTRWLRTRRRESAPHTATARARDSTTGAKRQLGGFGEAALAKRR